MNQSEKQLFLIQSLLNERSSCQKQSIPADSEWQKILLRGLMNVRRAYPIGTAFLQVQDEYLQGETAAKGVTDAADLTPMQPGLYLWQGDITTLKCDAIVNAANSGMTGCYIPNHRCIDNAIHTYAGVELRLACAKLMEQQGYIALSATRDNISISLRGKIKNIGGEKLDEIFEKNTYMQSIYPGDTRSALEVFCLYEADGEYFDISDPAHIVRDSFTIGKAAQEVPGYYVGEGCIGCKLCYSVCPQKCIDITKKPVVIDQHHCLHCGRCAEACPKQVIEKRF